MEAPPVEGCKSTPIKPKLDKSRMYGFPVFENARENPQKDQVNMAIDMTAAPIQSIEFADFARARPA